MGQWLTRELLKHLNLSIAGVDGTKMKVLVTGGAGYFGSLLCLGLRGCGYEVVSLDHIYGDGIRSLLESSGIQTVQGNIIDTSLTNRIVGGVDGVIHAAVFHHCREDEQLVNCSSDEKTLYENNVKAVGVLLNAALSRQVKRFVFLSSYYVYGRGMERVDERDAPAPDLLRGRMKLEAEGLCTKAAAEGLPLIVLRLPILYGVSPNMRWESVVHKFIKKMFEKKKPVIKAVENETRNFIAIEDAFDAVKKALVSKTEKTVFNVVGGDTLTIIDVAKMIIGHFGAEESRVLEIVRHSGAGYPLFESCYVQKELGYSPEHKLTKSTISRIVQSAKETVACC